MVSEVVESILFAGIIWKMLSKITGDARYHLLDCVTQLCNLILGGKVVMILLNIFMALLYALSSRKVMVVDRYWC